MKPPRGKREGPSGRPGVFKRSVRCRSNVRTFLDGRTGEQPSSAALTPVEGRDRSARQPNDRVRKVARLRTGVIGAPVCKVAVRPRRGRFELRGRRSRRRVTHRDCSQCHRARPPTCTCRARRREAKGLRLKSATFPTRLETRTKKSNACASREVVRNPRGAVKANVDAGRRRRDPARAHRRPISPVPTGRSSESAFVGTRKMVNYAWPG